MIFCGYELHIYCDTEGCQEFLTVVVEDKRQAFRSVKAKGWRISKDLRAAYGPLCAHPDGLARARRVAMPGCCMFCESPVESKGNNPRGICRHRDCKLAYHRAWNRDNR